MSHSNHSQHRQRSSTNRRASTSNFTTGGGWTGMFRKLWGNRSESSSTAGSSLSVDRDTRNESVYDSGEETIIRNDTDQDLTSPDRPRSPESSPRDQVDQGLQDTFSTDPPPASPTPTPQDERSFASNREEDELLTATEEHGIDEDEFERISNAKWLKEVTKVRLNRIVYRHSGYTSDFWTQLHFDLIQLDFKDANRVHTLMNFVKLQTQTDVEAAQRIKQDDPDLDYLYTRLLFHEHNMHNITKFYCDCLRKWKDFRYELEMQMFNDTSDQITEAIERLHPMVNRKQTEQLKRRDSSQFRENQRDPKQKERPQVKENLRGGDNRYSQRNDSFERVRRERQDVRTEREQVRRERERLYQERSDPRRRDREDFRFRPRRQNFQQDNRYSDSSSRSINNQHYDQRNRSSASGYPSSRESYDRVDLNRTGAYPKRSSEARSDRRESMTAMGNTGGNFRQNTGKSLSSGRPLFTRENTVDLNDREFRDKILEYRPVDLVDPKQNDAPPEFYINHMPPPFNQPPIRERGQDYFKMLRFKQLKFDGNPKKYIRFRNLFIAHVHTIKMAMAYKTLALVEALENIPRLEYVIENMNYNVLGYLNLIRTLEERYGGPESTVDHVREELEALPPLRENNILDLEKFVDMARNYVETMTTYDRLQECCTRSFDRMIEDKLPTLYETLYETWLQSTRRPRNGLSIIDWCSVELTTKLKSRKSARTLIDQYKEKQKPANYKGHSHVAVEQDCITDNEEKTSEPEPEHDAFVVNVKSPAENSGQKEDYKLCQLCKTHHWLSECPKFAKMNPVEKRRFITTARRCFRCLRRGHGIKECESKGTCKVCHGKHHTALHGSRPIHNQWEKNPKTEKPKQAQANCAIEDDGHDFEDTDNEEETQANVSAEMTETYTSGESHGNTSNDISLRIISAFVENEQGMKKKVNMLMDDGNNRTLVSTKLAQDLNLTGRKAKLIVNGIGGKSTEYNACLVKLKIISCDGKFKKTIFAKAIPNPLGTLQPLDWNDYKGNWSHLMSLQFPTPVIGAGIDIVLGNDYPTLMQSQREIPGRDDREPYARYTPLGWTAVGPVTPNLRHRDEADNGTMVCYAQCFMNKSQAQDNIKAQTELYSSQIGENVAHGNVYFGKSGVTHKPSSLLWSKDVSDSTFQDNGQEFDRELEFLFRRTLETETFPRDNDEDSEPSIEEKQALEILRSSRKKVDNKYQVSVMWKNGEPNLPNNYILAYSRLLSLEKSKHLATEADREAYNGVFRDWIKKGYVEKVPKENRRIKDAYYLPHFPVKRSDKTTSKVRPVLDGRVKFQDKSLNDAVHAGPKLINDLSVVLLRFRARPIAIGGDVAEMFLQIKMEPKDWQYHRFLFREKPEDELDEYEFRVHPFGNRGSPCVSIFVIKEHAKDNMKEFPRAAETVLESTVVDDNMDSVETIEEAKQLIQDLKQLYATCGMNIRKFVSNSQEVLESVPETDRAANIDLSHITTLTSENLPLVKTLGVIWVADNDQFTFAIEEPDPDTKWSKRETSRCAHRLYDPLGFISPFMVLARICGQECWKAKLDWDDPLPQEIETEWLSWKNCLSDLTSIQVPRCLKDPGMPERQELHIFTDASTKAYAAVAYVVSVYEDKTIVRFAMSRAKVAPLKSHSVPRLELIAAKLGTLLAKQVNSALKIEQGNIHFWSDSLNVLFWLNSTTKNLKTFVANRVTHIQDVSQVDNWHWVPTNENPADLASRGMLVNQLADAKIWWNGPEFLNKSKDNWPMAPRLSKTPEAAEEVKCNFTSDGQCQKEPSKFDYNYHSTLKSLVKMLSFPYFWLLKTRKQASNRRDPSVQKTVMSHLFRVAQREALEESLQEIENTGSVLMKNELSKLQPKLDSDGILRVAGRLQHAAHLSEEARCPIILPYAHQITRLIIKDTHESELKHVGGANHLLSSINTKYWVIRGRILVKRILRQCVRCRNIHAKVSPQKIAPLPDYRIMDAKNPIAAFSTVGIDCAGPFMTKQGRAKARLKRYMLLFCCAQYRAVHIEMLHSLDATSFLNAFSRFCARRGRPVRVVSDNGRNFVKGEDDLKELWKLLEEDPEVKVKYPVIEWVFNTPNCPHAGGLFERLIRSAKSAFYGCIGNAELNDEELQTTFAIVEGLLNSRPLSYVSNDPQDLEPITPSHFTGGKPFQDLAPVPEHMSLRSRWHYLQRIMDDFWRRFVREYLSKLHKLPKWTKQRENPKVGDVVIVLEEKFRGLWPLGRITDVWKSRDELVRAVDVEFNGRVLKRDVQKIIPIGSHELS